MKNYKYGWLLIVAIIILVSACKKDYGVKTTVGALNIINASVDASPMAINFAASSISWSKNTTLLYNNSFTEFSLTQGSADLNLISSADTTKPFFRGSLNLTLGGIYSFYVSGQSARYDTLFMKDKIPTYGADSVAGARFINLATDSQPLSINLVGNATPDFSSLPYKKITAFRKYSAVSNVTNNGGYYYEVRDASGNVLTTFNWNPATFKNNTLVITGLVGNGTVSVFAVNNY